MYISLFTARNGGYCDYDDDDGCLCCGITYDLDRSWIIVLASFVSKGIWIVRVITTAKLGNYM